MKATGIVRRIDDLGRVVIPKEIRRVLRLAEGEPLEIYTSNSGEVILKKYSHLGEFKENASDYVDCLNKISKYPVIICDKDTVIAAAGIPKKEVVDRRIAPVVDILMKERKVYIADENIASQMLFPIENIERHALMCVPIVAQSDVCGCIILMSEPSTTADAGVSEIQQTLIKYTALLLSKQLGDI